MEQNSHTPDDAELVRQVLRGNANAFEGLVERHGSLVLSIVKKHVPHDHIDDTTQEVFLRAYRSLPALKAPGNFSSWLSTIAVRACHDFWREQYKSREFPMSSLTEEQEAWLETTLSGTSTESFSELGLKKEAREILDWALARLSAGDRMAVELVYLEELSIKEAAAALDLNVVNVRVRLFRSRRKLLALLNATTQHTRGDP